MPRIIRQTLSAKLLQSPALDSLLSAFPRATGVALAFAAPLGQGEPPLQVGSVGLEAWLCTQPRGRRVRTAYWQRLVEAAERQPATLACSCGLSATAVPVRVGSQTIGALVTAAFLPAPPDQQALNRIRHLLSREGIDLPATELAELARATPVILPERLSALVFILQAASEHVATQLDERPAAPAAGLPELAQQVCRIIHADYASPIGVEHLARVLGVSEAHLSRTFHQSTGLRIVEYIARYRIERAHEQLCATRAPVARVAAACGFQSVSQFNRVFRARYGESPRDARSRLTPAPRA